MENQEISQSEFEAISALLPQQRYGYFLKQFAESQVLYTLADDEEDLALGYMEDGDGNGYNLLPVWPSEAFAEACQAADWPDHDLMAIELDSFIDDVLPALEEEGIMLNVFPTPGSNGFVIGLNEFRNDLDKELDW